MQLHRSDHCAFCDNNATFEKVVQRDDGSTPTYGEAITERLLVDSCEACSVQDKSVVDIINSQVLAA